MTYEEICNQDYTTLAYSSLLMSMVLLKQHPIQAILFDTDSKRQTLTIIKQSATGNRTTKRITARREDMQEIISFIQRDFPSLPFQYIAIPFDPSN